MLLKILSTIFSKILTAGIGFLVIVITARTLGVAIRGDIALLLLNISIIGLFQGIFNGAVLIYLTPRFSFTKLFIFANILSAAIAIGLPFPMLFFDLIPENQIYSLIGLCLIQGFLTTSQSLLLGKERIHAFNLLEILKSIVLLFAILILFWHLNQISFESVILAYLISYIIPFIFSLFIILPFFKNKKDEIQTSERMVSAFIKYGFEIQVNNISHMINYRFCFYIIEKWKGKDALGIFSIAISLCEAVWIICKSITTFQYTKVVNSTNSSEQIKLTIQSLQLSFLITLPTAAILLLIPNSIFIEVFGSEFDTIKSNLFYLSIAILSFSVFFIIDHYFSGIGKNRINISASIFGNIIIIVSSLLLVPIWGNVGAGIATSLTYLLMLIYLIFRFKKQSKTTFTELIPSRNSLGQLIQQLLKSK